MLFQLNMIIDDNNWSFLAELLKSFILLNIYFLKKALINIFE